MDSVVEHDGQMMLQEIWRMGRQLQVKVYKEVPAWHKLSSKMHCSMRVPKTTLAIAIAFGMLTSRK